MPCLSRTHVHEANKVQSVLKLLLSGRMEAVSPNSGPNKALQSFSQSNFNMRRQKCYHTRVKVKEANIRSNRLLLLRNDRLPFFKERTENWYRDREVQTTVQSKS